MLFHTHKFLVFFAVFLVFIRFFRGEPRVYFVTIASYIFYGWWYPPYVLILLGLTVFAHIGGRVCGSRDASFPTLFLLVLLGLTPLVIFKYTGFILDNVEALIGARLWEAPSWQLPLGISFITFTVLAYLIDIYSGRLTPEPRPIRTALFISFFPQLIAGPILRGHQLLPQLSRVNVRPSMLKLALLLFAIGAAKKVLFADQIGSFVDAVYASGESLGFAASLLAVYGFTVQIYCDFSGYTDMALALGYFLNIRLPENFRRPYGAASVRDFWRCWHMTLSSWLRDYLYIPLGGSRKGLGRMVAAAFVTMFLGGLWHGAAWTFVLWALGHGAMVVAEHMLDLAWPDRRRLPRWVRTLVTFHVVAALWVLFRAHGVDEAMRIFAGLFFGMGDAAVPVWPWLLIGLFLAVHPFDTLARVRLAAMRIRASVIIPLSVMVLIVCAALSVENPEAFIYFDF